MIRALPALALAALAATASAQQPAPTPAAPAAAASAPTIAAHGCQKPGEHPGRLASDNQRRAWVKTANGYLDCLKKFINDQQGTYNSIVEKAKPHLDAANATIDEYNKAVTAFKAEQDGGN